MWRLIGFMACVCAFCYVLAGVLGALLAFVGQLLVLCFVILLSMLGFKILDLLPTDKDI